MAAKDFLDICCADRSLAVCVSKAIRAHCHSEKLQESG